MICLWLFTAQKKSDGNKKVPNSHKMDHTFAVWWRKQWGGNLSFSKGLTSACSLHLVHFRVSPRVKQEQHIRSLQMLRAESNGKEKLWHSAPCLFLQWYFERQWVEWKEMGFGAWLNSADRSSSSALSTLSSMTLDNFVSMPWAKSIKMRLITSTLQGFKPDRCI